MVIFSGHVDDDNDHDGSGMNKDGIGVNDYNREEEDAF